MLHLKRLGGIGFLDSGFDLFGCGWESLKAIDDAHEWRSGESDVGPLTSVDGLAHVFMCFPVLALAV